MKGHHSIIGGATQFNTVERFDIFCMWELLHGSGIDNPARWVNS